MRKTFTPHRLAASAALAIAGATSLAAGSPALAAQPLAGTSVIEASAPAMTRVTLPQDTPFNEATTLSMSGGGRAIVFVMRPAGAPPTDARRVSSIQMNFCWTAGCKPDNPLTITNALNFDSSTPGSTTLPAGDYDVYLAPDGAPAAVTLKLDGLSGATTVHPSVPVQSHLEPATPTFAPLTGMGPVVYNAGGKNPIGAPGGVLFNALAMTGMGPGDAEGGLCWYDAGSAPPVDGVYFKCPNSPFEAGEFSLPLEAGAYHHLASGSASVVGDWSTGVYLYGAAPSIEAHPYSVGLTYAKPGAASTATTRMRTRKRTLRTRSFGRPRVKVARRRAR